MIEHWISTQFHPLTDLSTKEPAEIGESVLWRGVKTGHRGQPSTAVEHFHGKVRHVVVEDDTELYFYIHSEPIKEVRKVHASYVEYPGPSETWLCAAGGRCYREAEIRASFVKMVQCPACTTSERWFTTEAAYCKHFNMVHKSG